MTDQNVAVTGTTQNSPVPSEDDSLILDTLKNEAKSLNMRFHPKIGVKNLQIKIDKFKTDLYLKQQAENKNITTAEIENDEKPFVVTMTPYRPETIPERNSRLKKEALSLVRVRLTCMNPNKAEYQGEIFTVSNSIVGTVKNYIPFNADENGWFIPQILLNMILERKCQVWHTGKDDLGNAIKVGKLIKEFNIEYLRMLTPEEFKDLEKHQMITNPVAI